MSRASTDETVHFLISCIKFSNGGKVDFAEVANECNIVSKGAAAKRYERLIKSYNAAGTSTAGTDADTPDSSPMKAKASPVKKTKTAGEGSGPAKRKAAGGERKPRAKKARVSKGSVVASAEKLVGQRVSPVKEEDGSETEAAAVDDEVLFGQFCKQESDGQEEA